MKESIQIRINSPTFNKDADRYNLPPGMEQYLEEAGKERGGPGPRTSNQET